MEVVCNLRHHPEVVKILSDKGIVGDIKLHFDKLFDIIRYVSRLLNAVVADHENITDFEICQLFDFLLTKFKEPANQAAALTCIYQILHAVPINKFVSVLEEEFLDDVEEFVRVQNGRLHIGVASIGYQTLSSIIRKSFKELPQQMKSLVCSKIITLEECMACTFRWHLDSDQLVPLMREIARA
jgi:hypothetical protein